MLNQMVMRVECMCVMNWRVYQELHLFFLRNKSFNMLPNVHLATVLMTHSGLKQPVGAMPGTMNASLLFALLKTESGWNKGACGFIVDIPQSLKNFGVQFF